MGCIVTAFLLSRQWVILTLVAIALIPTMIESWVSGRQHRYEERTARNDLVSSPRCTPSRSRSSG